MKRTNNIKSILVKGYHFNMMSFYRARNMSNYDIRFFFTNKKKESKINLLKNCNFYSNDFISKTKIQKTKSK